MSKPSRGPCSEIKCAQIRPECCRNITYKRFWDKKLPETLRTKGFLDKDCQKPCVQKVLRYKQGPKHYVQKVLKSENERHAAWECSGKLENECHAAWERLQNLESPDGSPKRVTQKHPKPLYFQYFLTFFVNPIGAPEPCTPKTNHPRGTQSATKLCAQNFDFPCMVCK